MSIGKFFILAILLPMATIYLTLTLKGKSDGYVELETDHQSFNDSQKASLSSIDETLEQDDFSLSDEFVNNKKTTGTNKADIEPSEQSESANGFTSIEAMIRFKKNKKNTGNRNTVVKKQQTKNYSSILDNDESVITSDTNNLSGNNLNDDNSNRDTQNKLSNKSVAIVNTLNTPKISNSNLKPTKTLVNTTKTNKPKKLFKSVLRDRANEKPKKVVTKVSPERFKTRPITKNKTSIKPKTKVAKVNKPLPVTKAKPKAKKPSVKKASIKKSNTRTASANKNIKNTQVRKKQTVFKKQTIPTVRESTARSNGNLTTFKTNNFGDVFDEDADIDLELDAEVEVIEDILDNETTPNESIAENEDEDAKPKRFSTNPCSGRSARYIARCRKSQ